MILDFVDDLVTAYNRITKRSLSSFCILDGVEGQDTLVADDGSLLTLLRLEGMHRIIGAEESENIIQDLTQELGPAFSGEGHALQVWFGRDPEAGGELVEEYMRPPRRVARRLNLDLDDLFDERERKLPESIVWERCYLAVWTRLKVLQREERKHVQASMKAPEGWPSAVDAQNFFKLAHEIQDYHDGLVTTIKQAFDRLGMRVTTLSNYEAIEAIHASIYPMRRGEQFTPVLPDDLPPMRRPTSESDASNMLPPKLKAQLFDRESEVHDQRAVQIGDALFSTVDVHLGPKTPKPFNELIRKLRYAREFPWRASFLIEGDGLARVNRGGFKKLIASILAVTSTENQQLRNAIEQIEAWEMDNTTIPSLRMSFATWAPKDRRDLLDKRTRRLQGMVNGWGHCYTSDLTGDPLAGALTNALGLGCYETAPAAAPPLQDVIHMLPYNRDVSPWDSGAVLFRTPDGTPWPYEPGSDQQHTWIDIVFAPPGLGKSVLLNTVNLALCLSAGATTGSGGAELPRIGIIDIGPSSSGLISLLKDALPWDRKHEVTHGVLQMDESYAVNPFDTPLGARYPLPETQQFLETFVTLATSPVTGEMPGELSNLVQEVIRELYQMFDDQHRQGQPKRYTARKDPDVDEHIKNYNIEVTSQQDTWWSVVDKLFDAGCIRGATLAQRHAVPEFRDIPAALKSSRIQQLYGSVPMSGNQDRLTTYFQRQVVAAQNSYPILRGPTRFDLGNASIAALDINPAAPQGGAAQDRQTALVYLLARQVLAGDFYLDQDIVKYFPKRYRPYHDGRLRRLAESPKRLVMDEFHRTRNSDMVKQQVVRDMREGRKYHVQIMLASQMLEDFDPQIVEMASGVWVMGLGQNQSVEDTTKLFDLSNASKTILKRLNGPEPGKGAPFFVKLKMKGGVHEHMLYNSLGPTELWAFQTQPNDAALRNRLGERLGPKQARVVLAQRFPGGSAQNEIKRRVKELEQRDESITEDDASESVIDSLVEKLAQDGTTATY